MLLAKEAPFGEATSMRFARFAAVMALCSWLTLAGLADAQTKEKAKDDAPAEIEGKSFAQWKADIREKDISVRQHGIRMVVRFGPIAREAVPSLILALGERDASVRGDAAAALGMIGAMEKGIDPEEVPKVVTALSNLLGKTESQHSVRLQAALALAQMGPKAKAAIPTLCSVDNARDPYSWELRKAVCYALGRLGLDLKNGPDPRALTALLNSLQDPCGPVRLEAILSLSAMGVPSATPQVEQEKAELQKRLNDPDKTVAIWSRVLLYFLDEKLITEKGLSIITSYLKDPDPQVRKTATQALGILGPKAKSKVPDLIGMLRDKDLGVVLMAIRALGAMVQAMDSAVALGEIEGELQDTELAPRVEAVQILGRLGKKAKGSVPKIAACLKDKETVMVYATLSALAQLGAVAEGALPEIKDVSISHKDENVKKGAVETIKIINEAMKKK
jgi:HEAT repeat protein